MVEKAHRRRRSLGEDLIEALTDMQAYLRGEIELESYEVDDALLCSGQTVKQRKSKTPLKRN